MLPPDGPMAWRKAAGTDAFGSTTEPSWLDPAPQQGKADLESSESVESFRHFVSSVVDNTAIVLVASHGADAAPELPVATGWHFPRDPSGRYAGFYPADSAAAIAHIDELRRVGASAIAFPSSELWWLEAYPGLAGYLEAMAEEPARDPSGLVYKLGRDG